jgi:hypothetical protein
MGALMAGLAAAVLNPAQAVDSKGNMIEPQAGEWRTWVLKMAASSGRRLRQTSKQRKQKSLELKQLAKQRDQAALDQIAYWNTGASAYRWNEIALEEALFANMNSMAAGRAMALIHAAIYDATIAAWDAKYAYNRSRPSSFDQQTYHGHRKPSQPLLSIRARCGGRGCC